MLSNIRKKVSGAINEGISLPETMSTSLRQSPANVGIPRSIKLEAGAGVLHGSEENWKHLHEANEINAEKAEEIDKAIRRIKERFEVIFVKLTLLNATLEKSSNLQETLNNCVNAVEAIQSQCQSFEEKLVEFEDLCEEVSLQERQLEHKVQMSLYKQKKLSELELARQRLAEQHKKNVRVFEEKLRKLQLERQAAFQVAFQLDLELFKQQGSLPKIEPSHCSKLQLSLEDVDLDEGEDTKTELENFLKE